MIDLTGQRFGRLTVIAPAEDCDKEHFYPWKVRCDCGTYLRYHGTTSHRGTPAAADA